MKPLTHTVSRNSTTSGDVTPKVPSATPYATRAGLLSLACWSRTTLRGAFCSPPPHKTSRGSEMQVGSLNISVQRRCRGWLRSRSSTSQCGLRTKVDFEQHRPGLEAGGWRIGSSVRSHRVMLLESDGRRTHIAHFFNAAEWDGVNQRIFRDWLRSHPDDAQRYETAKRRAAATAVSRHGSYNAEKTEIVQQLVDQARAERGLPPTSVCDK